MGALHGVGGAAEPRALGRRLFVFSATVPEASWRLGNRVGRGGRPIDDTGTP